MSELIFNVLLLGVFGILFFFSGQIEIWDDYEGARYWPMAMIGITCLFLLAKVVLIFIKMKKEQKESGVPVNWGPVIKVCLAFLFCLIYVLLLPVIGFVFSTFLFTACFSRLLGAKSLKHMLIAGLGVTLPIFAVFNWCLSIILPRGIGIFYTISNSLSELF